MTTDEAARLLELPPDATPEQLETRFNELRRRLEDKIAKAPTPGLQAKYRASLADITAAFETLTLAADASSLPVLQRVETAAAAKAGGPASSTLSAASAPAPAAARPTPAAAPKKKAGSREFLVVAAIAVVVLGAGGWWVMKARAERAERIRIEAEAKAAEEARAAEQAKKAAQLRIELATAKVAWEALENRLRDAERRTSEAKSELRGFRDGPAWKKAELSALAHRHELYSTWLNQCLASHPAKIARAKAEQLLSDKLVDEAADAVAEMKRTLDELQQHVPERAARMLEGTSNVVIESKPDGIKFVFTDAYGRTTEGVTPAKLAAQPLSHLHDPKSDGDAGDAEIQLGEFSIEPSVRFIRLGWKDVVQSGRTLIEGAHLSAEFPEGSLEITSQPSGIPFVASNVLGWRVTGATPARLSMVPPGQVTVRLTRKGFKDVESGADVVAGKAASVSLDQRSQSVEIAVAEARSKIFVDGEFAGYEKASLTDLAPGEHMLRLEAGGYSPYSAKFTIKQDATRQIQSYSFKQLAQENITCSNCKGAGKFARQRICGQCGGSLWVRCNDCPGTGIAGYVKGDYGGGVIGDKFVTCRTCEGKGKLPCEHCQNGRIYWEEYCTTCGSDGRVSQLQLSQ